MEKTIKLEKINNFFDQFFNNTFLDDQLIYVLMFVALTVISAFVIKYIFSKVFRTFTQKTKTDYDDKILERIEGPIFNTVLFVGFWVLLFLFLGKHTFWPYISRIVITLFLFGWTVVLAKISKIIVEILSKSRRVKIINAQTIVLFRNLFVFLIYTIGLYIIFSSVWLVDMTAFIASFGVLGLAVSFAAKDTISNLFSGIFIIADKPYRVGDYVILGSGERGKVTSIGMRSTRILTALKTEISIPNSVIGNSKIVNESQGEGESFRLAVPFSIAYGEDIQKAQDVVLKIVEDKEFEEFRDLEIDPVIRFSNMGASSLDFNLYIALKEPAFRGKVKSALNTKIYNTFNQENIEIPYTKQDLYIKEFPKSK